MNENENKILGFGKESEINQMSCDKIQTNTGFWGEERNKSNVV